MLLSLFCGAGGLDLGFERAGYEVGLAFDRNSDSVASYNRNRPAKRGFAYDVAELTPAILDELHGRPFAPTGVIGGPPCQSFSQANVRQREGDPRHRLSFVYAHLLASLGKRATIDFFVLENVVGLTLSRHAMLFAEILAAFDEAGFNVTHTVLNALAFGVPQSRPRLFLVGLSRERFGVQHWQAPERTHQARPRTVRDAIGSLPEPAFFSQGLSAQSIPHHPNHWCMRPKSPKFERQGALTAGDVRSRSFKTLAWERPSITVAYGHREVHIHPDGKRRLSVFEAMRLQGFPKRYVLEGTLSSQINQVSDAVPPPLAYAVARSIREQTRSAYPSSTRRTSSTGRERRSNVPSHVLQDSTS